MWAACLFFLYLKYKNFRFEVVFNEMLDEMNVVAGKFVELNVAAHKQMPGRNIL